MKPSLLINLNNLVDLDCIQDKATKKSIEFFLGMVLDQKTIDEFKQKKCPSNDLECIRSFLCEKGMYLRDTALIKKFNEYYLGKEFGGLIKDCCLKMENKTLSKLTSKYNVILISTLPKEESEFIKTKLEINLPIINAPTFVEAVLAAKNQHQNLSCIVTNNEEHNIVTQNEITPIGMDHSIEEKSINEIEEPTILPKA